MPIYAYRCETCGHAKDVLQKISDPVLSTCPACGAQTFVKQVTAAGFQLKGSGWYVTDFRGGDTAKHKPEAGDAPSTPTDKPVKADSSAAVESKDAPGKPAADKPAAAAAPAPAPATSGAATPSPAAAPPPPAKS